MEELFTLKINVFHGGKPVKGATVSLGVRVTDAVLLPVENKQTNENGVCQFGNLSKTGDYVCVLEHSVVKEKEGVLISDGIFQWETPENGVAEAEKVLIYDIGRISLYIAKEEAVASTSSLIYKNDLLIAEFDGVKDWWEFFVPGWEKEGSSNKKFKTIATASGKLLVNSIAKIPTSAAFPGKAPIEIPVPGTVDILDQPAKPVTAQNFTVSHARKVIEPNVPMSFFVHLLNSSKSVEFSAYQTFINQVLCADPPLGIPDKHAVKLTRLKNELTDFGVGAYELLKTATEAFLLLHGCITPAHNGSQSFSFHQNLELGDYSRVPKDVWTSLFSHYLGDNKLPYIKHIIESALPEYELPEQGKNPRFCADILIRSRVNNPCFMELIWNYWHEEAMLVQTINAISRRFQNLRAPGERDPLAHVEIDPLRPLNNILWGYVEEERDRLSIKRRAHEYQHQYGLELYGKAVSNLRPADSRSKFLEAFHNLLNKCADYFRAKQDTTVDPDGYPMLHAIQELNLILAHGAHNQFGDLAWTSRVEMLMQEWILSRPEIRDFLQSRVMVPHKEAWMPQVDTMKTLQGWSDVAVTHFRDLGVLGEQILLTIRWHNWYEVTNEDEAKGWADLLRPHIQSYIHSYRAVTGVDLSATDGVDYTMPSVLLRKRLASQHAPR